MCGSFVKGESKCQIDIEIIFAGDGGKTVKKLAVNGNFTLLYN
jgi:hypothetical protein